MRTTDHLSHRHTPQEYAWDTVHWCVHEWLPAWLHTAELGVAAAALEGRPQIFDLNSYADSMTAIAIAYKAAEKVWQAYITSICKEVPDGNWWPVGQPIWDSVQNRIGQSGWWRMIQGCLRDPDATEPLHHDNLLVPVDIVSPTGDIWSIPRDIGRLHAWRALEPLVLEYGAHPIVTPDAQRHLAAEAKKAIDAAAPAGLQRQLA